MPGSSLPIDCRDDVDLDGASVKLPPDVAEFRTWSWNLRRALVLKRTEAPDAGRENRAAGHPWLLRATAERKC